MMEISIHNLPKLVKDNPELILQSFENLNLFKISIISFEGKYEYDSSPNINSGKKNAFLNEVDAFLSFWLADVIECEEWYGNYEQHEDVDFPKAIFQHWFLKDVEDFTLKPLTINFATKYINEVLKYKRQVASIRESYEGSTRDLATFQLEKENILKAIEISYDDSWAGYRVIFLETHDEYVLFSE